MRGVGGGERINKNACSSFQYFHLKFVVSLGFSKSFLLRFVLLFFIVSKNSIEK